MNAVYAAVRTVWRYVSVIGGGMFTALPLAVFIRVIAALRLKKLGMFTTRLHEFGTVLFVMYCAGLASVTVACNFDMMALDIPALKINLIPLKFVYDLLRGCYVGYPAAALINVIGNVAMFVPFGFLLSLLWRGAGWRKAALVSAAVSLCIELCQLPQMARTTDIDDILLNTLGGFLGYLLFSRIMPRTADRFRVINT
jgi:glycopeptide antibiotics resistance protein